MTDNLSKTIIGIDMGGTNIRAGVVKGEELIKLESVKIIPGGSKQEILDQFTGLIDSVISDDISAIGIGIPGVVDIPNGIVYDLINVPSWDVLPLKEILEKKYDRPVYINNDANCFALGEKYFGKGRDVKSFIGLIVGTGMGAGIIIDNRLYAGANCGAGEFGMVRYLDHIYEYYGSGQYFDNVYHVNGAVMAERAAKGDAEALRIFNELGGHMGEAIKMILFTYDPEKIVIGGSVRKSFRFYKEAMWESIRTFAYANSLDKLEIVISEDEHIAVKGAAGLVYNEERMKSV